jgi:hypothetical protein
MEALIAFALAAAAAGLTASLFAWGASAQRLRADRLALAEFARSVLEEYAATYPDMPARGTAPGGWEWHVTTAPITPDPVQLLRDDIVYLHLRADVWRADAPKLQGAGETLLALRAR